METSMQPEGLKSATATKMAHTVVERDAESQTTKTVTWWPLSDADISMLSKFMSDDGPTDLWSPCHEDLMILEHYLYIENRVLYDVEIRFTPVTAT